MLTKKVAMAAAAVAAAGAIVGGGAAISNASNATTGAASYGSGQQAQSGQGQDGQAQSGQAQDGQGRQQGQRGGMGHHEHTDVSGAEATKVTSAVTKKDAGVTVESVRKDPDGSYDVMGTKDGQPVMVEVSADLATIDVRTGGPGGPGGPGGKAGGMGHHQHTDVSGAEATKVTSAVTKKDASVTVESVRKDPDGSYDVMGTKDGRPVMVEVSADLATIDVRTGGPGGPGGPGGKGGNSDQGSQSGTQAPAASPSTSA